MLTEGWLWQESLIIGGLNYTENVGDGFVGVLFWLAFSFVCF